MAYADANGQKIFYVDSGGEGPPVVFSHGFAMDHSMFDAQVAALTPEFRCITWDQRAHGLTDDDGRPFDYWDSARDLLGLLDHLGLTSAVLVGMSQGAFLSMRAALEAPDRVKSLVIISSRAGLDPQEVYDGFAGLRAEWTANGPGNVRQNVADMLIGDPAYYPGWFAKWDQQDRARVGPAIDALVGRDDITDRVGSITAPALVFHGDADQAIPLAAGRELAAQLGNVVEFVEVPGAGHTANLTHAAAVTPKIEAFLRTHA